MGKVGRLKDGVREEAEGRDVGERRREGCPGGREGWRRLIALREFGGKSWCIRTLFDLRCFLLRSLLVLNRFS